MLPLRVGQAHAERMLLSGASIDAEAARSIGLVDLVADDPDAAAIALARERLLDKSGAALQLALRAARAGVRRKVEVALDAVERIYLDEVMATRDANEGIEAFLGKRPPQWEDR